jgi:hypothetical protein
LSGLGAHIGLPKAINGAEITSPDQAPESITYNAYLNDDGTLSGDHQRRRELVELYPRKNEQLVF